MSGAEMIEVLPAEEYPARLMRLGLDSLSPRSLTIRPTNPFSR